MALGPPPPVQPVGGRGPFWLVSPVECGEPSELGTGASTARGGMSLNLRWLWGCGKHLGAWGGRHRLVVFALPRSVWDLVPPRKRGSCEPDVYVEGGAGKSAWQCPFSSLGIALFSGCSLRRGPGLHCARLGMGTNSCESQIRKALQSWSHVATIHPALDRLPLMCWYGGVPLAPT